jgi:hypothetical protein
MHHIGPEIVLCVCTALVAAMAGPLSGGDDTASISMSVAEFAALTDDAKKLLLFEAFSRRIEHGRNIYYDSLLVMRNHHFADGVPGEVVWNGLKYGYRHWRLGDSYAVETTLYGDPQNEDVHSVNRSNYDASDGLVRGTTDSPQLKVGLGAISPRKDPQVMTNRYGYWFDGEKNGVAEFHFSNLVGLRDSYQIRVDQEKELVELKVPWHPRGFPDAEGTWTYQLDPAKGFLPLEGFGHWEAADPLAGDGPPRHWRTEQFRVQDSKLIGDQWMPTVLREIVRSSTAEKDVATVYDTTVTEIEQGGVTPADLVVEFGNKRWVNDRTQGTAYYTDAQGQPRPETVISAIDTGTPRAARESRSFTITVLFWINLAALVLYVVFRMRRRIFAK